MDALGQFDLVREGLTFLGTYQREDGKIPHGRMRPSTCCGSRTDTFTTATRPARSSRVPNTARERISVSTDPVARLRQAAAADMTA
jgi:hypothetical protein